VVWLPLPAALTSPRLRSAKLSLSVLEFTG
jgi:hypothetical protein